MTVVIIALAIILIFMFLVPIFPHTAPFHGPGPSFEPITIHYYVSLSSLFSPVGTSYYDGSYYFTTNPWQYAPTASYARL